jgi:flavodoxin I
MKTMARIGLFYGTQTGHTETVAEMLQQQLGEDQVDLHDISDVYADDLSAYQYLIVGCPTWNIGELQGDWDGFFPRLDEIDFSGKKVAYFGVGDQYGYPDNFLDAIGILEEKISERGGQTVGHWSVEGYEFTESKAFRDGKFVGLGLDEDNQPELTESRVQQWVEQLKPAFGL